MAAKNVDLVKLFSTVATAIAQNQTTLNQADTYNHDHGDNMVQIFEVITQAMKEKKNALPADQLAYASQILRNKSQSGSAQLYAEGLSDASSQFKGVKSITPDSAITLIQTLLGAQDTVPAASAPSSDGGADLLGSLFGGFSSTQQPAAPSTPQQGELPQIDIGQLLNAGMAFAQAKKAGSNNLDAILNAVVASSRMGTSEHRAQSGALVANTLLQVVSKLAPRK
ncbi:MAG: hypothetical protein FD147_610 [Chloroflexi bacterium]|nr:MAG: hypothetical protein FD147_610 [Chloroflexota bacterium]